MDDDPTRRDTDVGSAGGAPPSEPAAEPYPPSEPAAPAPPADPVAPYAPPGGAVPPQPAGWWQAPDGSWQPVWQQPGGWAQTPDGRWLPVWQQPAGAYGYQPQAGQHPYGPAPQAQGWQYPYGPAPQAQGWQYPAGAPAPAAQYAYGPTPQVTPPATPVDSSAAFGRVRGARPGQVPWTWRDVLLAIIIAGAPILVLTVVGMLAGSASGSQQTQTSGFALAAIVSTVLVDGWLVFWAWFFSLRKYHLPFASWGFRRYEERSAWAVAFALIVGGLIATNALGTLSDELYRKVVGPVPQENVVTIFPHTSSGLVLFAILAVLLAPVLEETFFRAFVFQGLSRTWGPIAGGIVSALIFAAWHQQLSVLIPIFGLGMVLAAAFYWTRSIYTNMTLHAIFNAIGIVAWWFIKTKS